MPKIVTTETRIMEVKSETTGLAKLVQTAKTAEDWAEVARRAGAVQRRTRQLAGLGRGG